MDWGYALRHILLWDWGNAPPQLLVSSINRFPQEVPQDNLFLVVCVDILTFCSKIKLCSPRCGICSSSTALYSKTDCFPQIWVYHFWLEILQLKFCSKGFHQLQSKQGWFSQAQAHQSLFAETIRI
jgi:hypothetical protein